MGGGSGKQVGCPGCWSGLASHHPPGPCAVSLGSPGAICAEVVLRHSLGRRFWGPEEPLSESDAGSSGLSSTVRTDGGKGQAYQSLWRLPGSGWGRAGPRAPMGRSALRCAEQDMGWSRAWLAGESRERVRPEQPVGGGGAGWGQLVLVSFPSFDQWGGFKAGL